MITGNIMLISDKLYLSVDHLFNFHYNTSKLVLVTCFLGNVCKRSIFPKRAYSQAANSRIIVTVESNSKTQQDGRQVPDNPKTG